MKEHFELYKLAFKAILKKIQVAPVKEGFSVSIKQEIAAGLAKSYADEAFRVFHNLPKQEDKVES